MKLQCVKYIIFHSVNSSFLGGKDVDAAVFGKELVRQLERQESFHLSAGKFVKCHDRIRDASHHGWERGIMYIGMLRAILPVEKCPVIKRFIPHAFIHGTAVSSHVSIEPFPSRIGGVRHFRHDEFPSVQMVENISGRTVQVIDDSDVQLTLSDERIEKAIVENNARLVIIDPIQAYLGADVDMNRANEVRPIFMRLGQVAQRTGCAILLIGHLNKAAGMQSLQRGLGSIDIAAAVRSVMFIGKLKHDPTMRILTHEKSSLAPPGASLAFSLGDEGGFRWVGEYDITADEMLSGIEPQRETKTQQAKDLICALLAGGKQVFSEDIDKAALERGIPGRTVRDAKRELGDALKSKIVEGRKKVFWME